MSLLKAEPPDAVRSLPELFALAHAMEEEAATRYAALADSMEAMGLARVAAVFRDLVEEERGHAHHVDEWSRGVTGSGPSPAQLRWTPPETMDEDEARGFASSHLASAYRALSMAVRNEERAFALWTYIAARAESPEIRRAAERMAEEELRHAALLRRERRRAFREDRQPGAPRGHPLARAAAAEARLATILGALPGDGTRLAAEARAMGEEASELAEEAGAAAAPPPSGTDGIEEALRLAEQASEAYLDAADAAREDRHLGRLQSLAERAIARIAVLRRENAGGVPAAG
ncbi:ferritin-like domain-containing protein [Falsiroseomonas sp. CW058]|uniref:ferritin-like domain-containing protein n=1 Tax=Falsiroseomonas sp. CW058 TaxID=3388664 RepID=UPI003D324031